MAFQRRPSTQLLLGTSPKDPVLHLDILSQPQIVPIGLNTWTPVKGPRNQNPPNALDPVRALVQGRYESYGVPLQLPGMLARQRRVVHVADAKSYSVPVLPCNPSFSSVRRPIERPDRLRRDPEGACAKASINRYMFMWRRRPVA